jgi:hypothetical protein
MGAGEGDSSSDTGSSGSVAAAQEAEGARWLGLAAQQGEATAQCWLGACCTEGRGVPVDKAMAVRWYEAAAAQGHARAQSNLGAKNALFAPFLDYKRPFYRDRLGTNIGRLEESRRVIRRSVLQ